MKRDLLVNYDKFSRPSEHYNTTKVGLSLSVKHLDLEETRGVLTIFGWLSMVSWKCLWIIFRGRSKTRLSKFFTSKEVGAL